jgi:hypothetical protein
MRYLAASLCAVLASHAAAQDDLAIRWQTDFARARAKATEQHRPLLLLFRCER